MPKKVQPKKTKQKTGGLGLSSKHAKSSSMQRKMSEFIAKPAAAASNDFDFDKEQPAPAVQDISSARPAKVPRFSTSSEQHDDTEETLQSLEDVAGNTAVSDSL